MSSHLRPEVRRLIAVDGVWSLGLGMVLPLTLIYLHRVRHIPLVTTGVLLGLGGLVGLVGLPLVGALTDRFGARRVLPVLGAGMGLAELSMAWAHSATTALLPVALSALTTGSGFTVFSARLGELCPDHEEQQRAFAVNFIVINGGIGLGSLVSASVVDAHHPGTFQLLYLAAAAADELFALLLIPGGRLARTPAPHRELGQPAPSYQQLLRRPGMPGVAAVALLIALCGYAAVDSGLPAYANVVAHVSPRVIALSVSVNTAVIVVVQLVVLRFLRGRRLSRCLASVGLVWAACWLLLGASALPGADWERTVMVLGFAALFGIGETVMQPTLQPLVNALAGDELRGRANALIGGSLSLAFVISPALAGTAIAAGLGGVWIGGLIGCALGVSVAAMRLGYRIGPVRDRGQDPALAQPALPVVG